jgi:hypothetical protein
MSRPAACCLWRDCDKDSEYVWGAVHRVHVAAYAVQELLRFADERTLSVSHRQRARDFRLRARSVSAGDATAYRGGRLHTASAGRIKRRCIATVYAGKEKSLPVEFTKTRDDVCHKTKKQERQETPSVVRLHH